MSKNKITIDFEVQSDGSLKMLGQQADKTSKQIDKMSKSQKRAEKSTGELTKSKNHHNRVEKGTAGITANSSKAFSKQAQSISGGIVPAYAVLAANIFALTAAFGFLKRAADVQLLQESQVSFAQNTGIAMQTVTKRLREASAGMLGFREAAEASAIGLAKGFSPKQLEDLAVGAKKASAALGRGYQDTFDRLIRGASKAEPELLDELGITLRLKTATEKYAAAIGTQAKELTTAQRSQAVLLETQRQLNDLFSETEASANPFVKLSKTFEDIVRAGTSFILPFFKSLATIINSNVYAAVAVFGFLAVNILKSIIPMDKLKEKFTALGENSKQNMLKSKEYVKSIKRDIKDLNVAMERAKQNSKSLAAQLVKQGSTSKIAARIAKGGGITAGDAARVEKTLKSAEKQYKEFGRIKRGVSKNTDIQILRDFSASLTDMEKVSQTRWQRMGMHIKKWGLVARATFQRIKRTGTVMFGVLARGANFLGKTMGAAMKMTGIIGIITMVYELVVSVINNIYSIALAVAKGIDTVFNLVLEGINWINLKIREFADGAVSLWHKFTDMLRDTWDSAILGIMGGLDRLMAKVRGSYNNWVPLINKFVIGANMEKMEEPDSTLVERYTKKIEARKAARDKERESVEKFADSYVPLLTNIDAAQYALENSPFWQGVKKWEEHRKGIKNSKEALKAYKQTLESMSGDLNGILEGVAKLRKKDPAKAGVAIATALSTLDIAGMARKLNAKVYDADGNKTDEFVLKAEQRKEATKALQVAMARVKELSPKLAASLKSLGKGIDSNVIGSMENMQIIARDAVTNFSSLKDQINDLSSSISSGDLGKAEVTLSTLTKTAKAAREGFKAMGSSETVDEIKNMVKRALGEGVDTNQMLATLIRVRQEGEEIARAQAMSFTLSGQLGSLNKAQLSIAKTRNEVEKIGLKLQINKDASVRKTLIQQQKILKIQEKQAEVERARVLQGDFGGDLASFSTAVNQAGVEAEAEVRAKPFFKMLNEEGKKAAINSAVHTATVAAAWKAIPKAMSPYIENLKKLGPEGELLGAVLNGAFMIQEAWKGIGESIKTAFDGTASYEARMQSVSAVFSALAATINQISSIMAAKSNQRIAAIDKEIAAEKKRDGKSIASAAKIAALEKKKEAAKKKAFNVEKKLRMASIVMSTAAAVAGALATHPIGPWNIAFAAIMAAMGAAQLAIVAGTSYDGGNASTPSAPSKISVGERGSSVDVTKSRSPSGEQAYFRGELGTGSGAGTYVPNAFTGRAAGGNTAFIAGEQGPELVLSDLNNRVVPADDTAEILGGGTRHVTFNIQTIDAQGMEDVLNGRRDYIIEMIREAANDRGEPFLETLAA